MRRVHSRAPCRVGHPLPSRARFFPQTQRVQVPSRKIEKNKSKPILKHPRSKTRGKIFNVILRSIPKYHTIYFAFHLFFYFFHSLVLGLAALQFGLERQATSAISCFLWPVRQGCGCGCGVLSSRGHSQLLVLGDEVNRTECEHHNHRHHSLARPGWSVRRYSHDHCSCPPR